MPLASSQYRKGLLQPAIRSITQVLPHVTKARSELNNILGDAYWITGDIHRAIDCQKQTLSDMAKRTSCEKIASTDYYFKMLTVDAHLSLGLYYIDLWELDQAASQFETVIARASATPHQAWADKATVGLSLVRAYLGEHQKATTLVNEVAERLTLGTDGECGRYGYFLQLLGQACSQLHLFDQAETLHTRAMLAAETGHYVQVKARTLAGRGVLKRQQDRFSEAIALHQQAIALCAQIGAVCDQAEAYLQLALTLQSVEQATEHATVRSPSSATPKKHDVPKHHSKQYFQQARSLLSTMGAPNRLARLTSVLSS